MALNSLLVTAYFFLFFSKYPITTEWNEKFKKEEKQMLNNALEVIFFFSSWININVVHGVDDFERVPQNKL